MTGIMLIAALLAPQIDWQALPPLPWRAEPQVTKAMNDTVARQMRQQKCPQPAAAADGVRTLKLDLAVMIDAESSARVVVPRAIDCTVVEQYAAGLVTGFVRDNLLPRTAQGDQWFKTQLVFVWR